MGAHFSIEQQKSAVGATGRPAVDRRRKSLGDRGFGAEVWEALRQRSDFLVEQGLAERRGQRVILARNLLATLRERDIGAVALRIPKETGLAHRPVVDGERVSGYRRNGLLTSGRIAMIDDGMGFSLLPWKPGIEQRLGQTIRAVVHGSGVSWESGDSLDDI